MAFGHELFLAVKGRTAIDVVVSGIGLEIDWENGDWAEECEAQLNTINTKLALAQEAALTGLGMVVAMAGSGLDSHIFVKGLDSKVREMRRWCLTFSYDPFELGDDASTAIVGVALTARYYPVFLDWQEQNGGSGDMIVLDDQTNVMIKLARHHLGGVLPFIEQAPVIIKEIHY